MMIDASVVLTPEVSVSTRTRPPDPPAFVSHAWSSTLVIDAPAGRWTPASSDPPEVTYFPAFHTNVVDDWLGLNSKSGMVITASEAVPYVSGLGAVRC